MRVELLFIRQLCLTSCSIRWAYRHRPSCWSRNISSRSRRSLTSTTSQISRLCRAKLDLTAFSSTWTIETIWTGTFQLHQGLVSLPTHSLHPYQSCRIRQHSATRFYLTKIKCRRSITRDQVHRTTTTTTTEEEWCSTVFQVLRPTTIATSIFHQMDRRRLCRRIKTSRRKIWTWTSWA